MTPRTGDRPVGPVLVALAVADAVEAWEAAGFVVDGGYVRLGDVAVRLVGDGTDDGPAAGDGADDGAAPRGIVAWELAGVALTGDDLDGLPTTVVDGPAAGSGVEPTVRHPNGVVGLDHVVVATPDLDRTLDALATAGLDLRRIRETTSYGSPMRQAFFRLGPTILEVVGGEEGDGRPATESPATWFGLALDVDDLATTAVTLGPALGPVKPAVQPGRRIATLRHRDLGLSVPLAFMDDHAGR